MREYRLTIEEMYLLDELIGTDCTTATSTQYLFDIDEKLGLDCTTTRADVYYSRIRAYLKDCQRIIDR